MTRATGIGHEIALLFAAEEAKVACVDCFVDHIVRARDSEAPGALDITIAQIDIAQIDERGGTGQRGSWRQSFARKLIDFHPIERMTDTARLPPPMTC